MSSTTDMKKYYEVRKDIHKLYSDDSLYGDLPYQLRGIKDKHRCVNSMNIDIENYEVDIDFVESTSEGRKNDVITKVGDTLKQFITSNRTSLQYGEDKELDEMLNSPNMIFCDIVTVGNCIQFKL